MTDDKIFGCIDHTNLKAFATWEDIVKLCDEAIKYKMVSVCVPQSYVKRISETYQDNINICTVIGFPLGYQLSESKIIEAKESIKNGASEIDMVINITDVKNGDYDKVLKEISDIKKACGDKILKVIIETCFLTNDEKIKLCKVVTDAGADYIKTSTGFGTGGATREDVILMKENIGANVKIKAAGGVRTKSDLIDFIELGCDRIGTSSAIDIMNDKKAEAY